MNTITSVEENALIISKKEKVVWKKLENGLDVILMRREGVPVVAVDIWYKVGSRNEKPGKSGFAHLFEHMMFEGSENVGKAEHIKLINDVGGMVNGSTSQDRTNYWEVVPANQLELALFLEADRMRSLKLNQENFENQRDTVKEERRQRIDNQPYMRVLYELKDEVAYTNYAYKHSVIGSMNDLDRATLEDVREFHDLYYRPNNAVLAIVGEIDIDQTLRLVRRYFENISQGPPIPPVDLTEPEQTQEKKRVYTDTFAPFPATLISYHVPERTHPDFYVLEIIEKILLDGESSRMYRKIVEENQSALHILGGLDGKFGPGLFFVFAQVHPASNIGQLLEDIFEEFERIKNEAVNQDELQKAKNKIMSDWVSKKEMVRTIADNLCMYTALFNDPELFFSEISRFQKISVEDVQQVAHRYFNSKNRTVLEVYPDRKGKGRSI